MISNIIIPIGNLKELVPFQRNLIDKHIRYRNLYYPTFPISFTFEACIKASIIELKIDAPTLFLHADIFPIKNVDVSLLGKSAGEGCSGRRNGIANSHLCPNACWLYMEEPHQYKPHNFKPEKLFPVTERNLYGEMVQPFWIHLDNYKSATSYAGILDELRAQYLTV